MADAKAKGRSLLECEVIGHEAAPLTWYLDRERSRREPELI